MAAITIFLILLQITSIFSFIELNEGQSSCISCICYANSFCFETDQCAKTISKSYWEAAGAPLYKIGGSKDQAYDACMKDWNCILFTIHSYTDLAVDNRDVNCDGKVMCKDRLVNHSHQKGSNDYNLEKPMMVRFDSCAMNFSIPNVMKWEPCDSINDKIFYRYPTVN